MNDNESSLMNACQKHEFILQLFSIIQFHHLVYLFHSLRRGVRLRNYGFYICVFLCRCYFSCEVLNGKIYAIGGLSSKSSDSHSWDTYDPYASTWTSHSDPNIVPEIEDSFVMDGKIYIRCCTSPVTSHVYAVVYEPSSGIWQHADADMVSGWRGPAVVVDGTLYVLDQSSGTRLMMWKKETREWVPVGRLSPLLTRPPCQLVAVGTSIFVIGKGLSTVMLDVGKAGNVEGAMVSSSIPNLS